MQTGRWTPSLTGRRERPKIAILDTGLDTTSPDWNAPGPAVSGWDVVRGVGFVGDAGVEGHGTHVAGIAAAPANGTGVVGVAPATGDPAMPGARVIAVKITFRDSAGFDVSTDATQMAGIVYAVNHGAKVINISSGGPGYNQAFQDTVDWAMKRGALVVASVGNDGQGANEVNYPAGYDHVVGVAASCDTLVDGFDCLTPRGRATFSNFNFSVDVLAPGVRILSTLPTRVADPAAPAGYGSLDGTSMAAPYVTGTAALVASSHPNASPYQVLRVIETTADRAVAGVGRSSKLGWGELNPARAVNAIAPRNDLTEPNDDVNWLQKRFDIVLARTARVVSVTAHADYNDDHLDVYAVPLARGRRVRVTLTARGSRLAAFAFDGKGRIAPEMMSDTQFNRRVRGMTKTFTPGKRSFTFTARRTGRHFIQIVAGAGGTAGEYTLRVERLN
jgi:subtilisin family serine protease